MVSIGMIKYIYENPRTIKCMFENVRTAVLGSFLLLVGLTVHETTYTLYHFLGALILGLVVYLFTFFLIYKKIESGKIEGFCD